MFKNFSHPQRDFYFVIFRGVFNECGRMGAPWSFLFNVQQSHWLVFSLCVYILGVFLLVNIIIFYISMMDGMGAVIRSVL